jgi:hypothetical protein
VTSGEQNNEELGIPLGGGLDFLTKQRALQILGNNQLDALLRIFISCLYMFSASQRTSSGDPIVILHHLV